MVLNSDWILVIKAAREREGARERESERERGEGEEKERQRKREIDRERRERKRGKREQEGKGLGRKRKDDGVKIRLSGKMTFFYNFTIELNVGRLIVTSTSILYEIKRKGKAPSLSSSSALILESAASIMDSRSCVLIDAMLKL